jgi:hypothetical protein
MTEQAEPSESKESKTSALLTRWPRDLTDLWAGLAPSAQWGGPFETSRSKNSSMATIW